MVIWRVNLSYLPWMFELRYYCYSSERWGARSAIELLVRRLHSIIFYVKHTAHA